MSGVDRDHRAASPPARRDRWRPLEGRRVARQRTLPPQRLGWTLASLAAVAALAALVIPPLFTSRTVVVLLSIDDLQTDVVAPVPFGAKDRAAIAEALEGRLSPGVNQRSPVIQTNLAAAALQKEVFGKTLAELQVATRDTLIVVVRGQTIVATDNECPRSFLLASDVSLPGERLSGIVPLSELLAAITSVPARRVVVILDMGDIRWDPRLGAIAGIVPAFLDEECRTKPGSGGKECWILGSHDVHQFSGVSLAAQRGFFLRAVELALKGQGADDRKWGGDGDGSIELLEFARFVAAWTSHWATEDSGGVFDQQPILWKVGFGRVPLHEVSAAADEREVQARSQARLAAAAVRLLPVRREPPPTRAVAKGQTDTSTQAAETQAAESGAAPQVAPPAATPAAAPLSGDARAAAVQPNEIWDLIELISKQPYGPVDYAPHLWRHTTSRAAAVAATPDDGSELEKRHSRLKKSMNDGLKKFVSNSRVESSDPEILTALSDLKRRADEKKQVVDDAIRSAIAARNRAADLASAALDYHGRAMGSEHGKPLARLLPQFLTEIEKLHDELERQLTGGSSPADRSELTDPKKRVEEVEKKLRNEVATVAHSLCEAAITNRADWPSRIESADARLILASRLPTAEQRRCLTAAVQPHSKDALLGLELAELPQIPPDRDQGGLAFRKASRWDEVDERVKMAETYLKIFRSESTEPAGESASGEAISEDQSSGDHLHRFFEAGQQLAKTHARIPDDIKNADDERNSAAGKRGPATRPDERAFTIDSLLRLLDPRDVDREGRKSLGWLPPGNVVPASLASSDSPGSASPRVEQLTVTLSGRLGTIEGGCKERRVTVDPVPAGDESRDSGVGRPDTDAKLELRPFPGQVTTWSLSLANGTGKARTLRVDLLSVGGTANAAKDGDEAWASWKKTLALQQPLEGVVALSGTVKMPATTERIPVTLTIPQPAEPRPNGSAAAPSPPAIPVGGTLGLIIRDDRPEAASQDGGETAAAIPAVSARPRTWIVRLPMEPLRPRSYLEAEAVWSEEDEKITVAVKPLDKGLASLPDGKVQLRLSRLPGADNPGTDKTVDATQLKGTVNAEISEESRNGNLSADWKPGDELAELAVDVDNYPRAFIFRVKTLRAKNGEKQEPHRSWKKLVMVKPEADRTPVKSGTDAVIDVHLAVDIPADKLPRDKQLIELKLWDHKPPEKPDWTADSDRQVKWSLLEVEPSKAFGIRADVGDWHFQLPAKNFQDVDVTLECRLLAGDQGPVAEKRVVVFDGSPPKLEIRYCPREVEKGKAAHITVHCSDEESGTSTLEWAIKSAGKPPAWERQTKASEGQNEVVVQTDDLLIGQYDVLIRATDRVGLKSREQTCEMKVTPAPVMPAAGGEEAP